jgi:hypothetical protein
MATKPASDPPKGIRPNCRFGHGPMEKLPTTWALTGLDTRKGDEHSPYFARANGRAYALTVYRCSECGALELFDFDVAGLPK